MLRRAVAQGSVKLTVVAGIDGKNLLSRGSRGGFHLSHIGFGSRVLWVGEKTDQFSRRRHLVQKLQLFRGQRVGKQNTIDIEARVRRRRQSSRLSGFKNVVDRQVDELEREHHYQQQEDPLSGLR